MVANTSSVWTSDDAVASLKSPTEEPATTITIRYKRADEVYMLLDGCPVPASAWQRSSVLQGVVQKWCNGNKPADVHLPFAAYTVKCWLKFRTEGSGDPESLCKALDVRCSAHLWQCCTVKALGPSRGR